MTPKDYAPEGLTMRITELVERCEDEVARLAEEAFRHLPGKQRSSSRGAAAEWAVIATSLRARIAAGREEGGETSA